MFKEYRSEFIKGYRSVWLLVALFFILSLYNLISTSLFIYFSNTIDGEIISEADLRYGNGWFSDGFHYPTAWFFTPAGEKIEVVSKTNFNSDEIKKLRDTKIKIFYNPSDPHDAKLDFFSDLWFWSIAFALMGLAILLVDYWLFLTCDSSITKNTISSMGGRNPHK